MMLRKLTYFLLLMVIGYTSQAFQDKGNTVYIAMDKPYHAAGEFLAYTLYNLESGSNYLAYQPVVAYVDLIHPYGTTVLTQALQLADGRASGVLTLPDTLSGGVYKLIASIAGQGNQKSFTREIVIDGAAKLNIPTRTNMKLILSPEGGRIVNGISAWVGVKFTNSYGFPSRMATTGSVKKTNGDVITRFDINESGYGKFQLLPVDGQKYTVEVTVFGQVYTQPLIVTQQGFTISAAASDADTIRIIIKSSPDEYGKKFRLKMHARGKVNLETTGHVNSPTGVRIKIPTTTVWQGVNEIQLGIEGDSVYGKRAIYVPAGKRIQAEITMSKSVFNPRETGTAVINLKDQFNKPVSAKFTTTIYESRYASSYSSVEEAVIFGSYNGYSESKTQNNLFEDEMLNFYSTSFTQPDAPVRKDFINVLEGRLTDPQTAQPLSDTTVFMTLVNPLNPHPIILIEKTDADGNLKVVMPPVNGNLSVFVKVKDVGELSRIQFTPKSKSSERLTNAQPASKSTARFELGNANGYYKILSENKSVSEAYGTRPIEILEDDKDAFSSFAFTKFTTRYNLNEYLVPATLKEAIADIVNGVVVRKRKGRDELRVNGQNEYNKRYTPPFRAQPLMLVDGVPVIDPAIVFALPPEEILTIEMNHDSLFYKNTIISGVFSVTTRNRQFLYQNYSNQYSYTTVSLQSPVSFKFPTHQPASGKKQLTSSESPDFRSLLFYQPLAETNATGESQFQFWTSDDQGKFILSIEGVTDSGIPFHYTAPIEVKKN